jgi:single-strand DNA-binding protein
MKSVNRVILVGNLGSDPDVRYTKEGKSVAVLSLATNESYKTDDGEKKEVTDWHAVVVWGRQADLCGQYLRKGSLILAEGKMKSRLWVDKGGQKHKAVEVLASSIKFLDKLRKETVDENQNALSVA